MTLKISALFLGLILWLHATSLQIYEQELSIPLRLTGLSDSLVVVSPVPSRAQVAFRGKGDQIWWLYLRKTKAVVSLEGVEMGGSTLEIPPGAVHIPSGVKMQGVSVIFPRRFRVEVDRLKRKTIPILVKTAGLPAPGYVRVDDEITIEPEYVTVEGPAALLDDLDRVHADPLDISGAKGIVSKELPLKLPDSQHLRASTEIVRAKARIEKLYRRTFHVFPEFDEELPDGWEVVPSSVVVHFLAPKSVKDSLDLVDQAALDLRVLLPARLEDSLFVPVSLSPPTWVTQCIMTPEQLLLRAVPEESDSIASDVGHLFSTTGS